MHNAFSVLSIAAGLVAAGLWWWSSWLKDWGKYDFRRARYPLSLKMCGALSSLKN